MNKLTIRCRNNGRKISVPFGSTLYDVFGQAGRVALFMFISFCFKLKTITSFYPFYIKTLN